MRGFIQGATAAATGAIAGAAIVIAGQVITGPLSVAIALVALVLLLQRCRKLSEPSVVGPGGDRGARLVLAAAR